MYVRMYVNMIECVNMARTIQSLIYLKYDHLHVLEVDISFVDILCSVAIVEHDK